jgi:hypothetical protein
LVGGSLTDSRYSDPPPGAERQKDSAKIETGRLGLTQDQLVLIERMAHQE